MTSPYIAREAERLRIGSQAKYRRTFARDQREAGISHLEWENRLRPVTSWAREIIKAIAIFILIAATWHALNLLLGV